MVIATVVREQKPTGGSSFGGNFSKSAFAAYVYPRGKQLQRDGTQRRVGAQSCRAETQGGAEGGATGEPTCEPGGVCLACIGAPMRGVSASEVS